MTIEQGTLHQPDWNNFELGRGESKTIITNWVHAPIVPSAADVAIVVDVRPFRWFPWSFRRYFRFTGAYVDNWQWLKQPCAEMEAEANQEIDKAMKRLGRE